MNYTCGNCKNLKYRNGYLYPYSCRYEKELSFTVNGLEQRVKEGFKCDKYEYDELPLDIVYFEW